MRSTDDRILEYVSFSDAPDRASIARDLNLPTPTVVSAVRRLIAAGQVQEADLNPNSSGTGRPSRGLRAIGNTRVIGLVGWHGATIRLRCLDVSGHTLARSELDRPDPAAGVEGLFDAVDALAAMTTALPEHELGVIVFAVPAPFLSGRGAPVDYVGADGSAIPFPITAAADPESVLTARLGIPVIIENDANLAAIGELYRGVSRGAMHSIYLKLTPFGFGSALIVNGALVRGARGYAGELSHLQVDEHGPLCACGGRGCLLYRVREQIVAAAQPAYDEPITFGDLPRLAGAGDLGAARLLRDIGRTLGTELARLSTVLDPESIVVGGSFGDAAAQVLTGIRDSLSVQAPPAIANNVKVLAAELGDDGELIGALELARLAARATS